jgi:hypothetical protein
MDDSTKHVRILPDRFTILMDTVLTRNMDIKPVKIGINSANNSNSLTTSSL